MVELLAVIVILAVILAIAIPSISKTIDSVKKGAFESSVHGYAKAAENKYLKDMITGNSGEMIFIYENGILIEGEELNYDGERITNGAIHLRKDGKVALAIYNDKWCAIKDYDSKKIGITPFDSEEGCEIPLPVLVDQSGANPPVLATEMTPIIWNEEEEEWIEATNYDNPYEQNWYDYGNKKWANAQTKDGSYWVWIPRYAYKIIAGYNSSTTGTIDIKFLRGITNDTKDGNTIETSGYAVGVGAKNTSTNYFLNPSFDFDGNIPGFWVAKFEPTAAEGVNAIILGSCEADNVSTKTVKVIPNAPSWRCINIKNAYTVSLNMKDKTDVYGWSASEVDTHMMKNKEWGAVAYLSKSIYGKNTAEPFPNPSSSYITGRGGNAISQSNTTDNSGSASNTLYGYNGKSCSSKTGYVCTGTTHATYGMASSTTGNIYGVYDMSGGAYERVMGNYNNLVGDSDFTIAEFTAIELKHITKYTTEDLLNGIGMNYDTAVYGDAIYETSNNAARWNGSAAIGSAVGSWYGEVSRLPYSSYPWFNRGGCHSDGLVAGVFYFQYSNGIEAMNSSFRVVVIPQ